MNLEKEEMNIKDRVSEMRELINELKSSANTLAFLICKGNQFTIN